MKSPGRVSLVAAGLVLTIFGFGNSQVQAVEVLQNTSLEESVGPAGWEVTQFITGEPSLPIGAFEHVGLANNPPATPGALGLFLKPQSGNTGVYADQNKAVNVIMMQTFAFGPSAAGRQYTFSGQSLFQTATSANLDTLFPDSPSGEVPSPTEAYFQMEFLNASDQLIGSVHRLDLPKNRPTDMNPEDWLTHNIIQTAPAGTEKIRVTAAATDMVASCTDSCPAGQDIYFDNFSLIDSVFPSQRLVNANLNTLGAPGSWEVEKTEEDNISFTGSASFAAHTGNTGLWLRSFAGGDAKIFQTVPGVAGEDYTFTAWGKLQEGHCGLDPLSPCTTFMSMEFLDGSGNPLEITPGVDEVFQDVGLSYTWEAGEGGQGVWQQIGLPTTAAPAGTASVRVSVGATDMENTTINPQSALFDDFSLMTSAVGLEGDYNGDGKVDAADYVVWRKDPASFGGDPAGYNTWRANFGNMLGSGSGGLAAVPEPSSLVLLVGGVLAIIAAARRQR